MPPPCLWLNAAGPTPWSEPQFVAKSDFVADPAFGVDSEAAQGVNGPKPGSKARSRTSTPTEHDTDPDSRPDPEPRPRHRLEPRTKPPGFRLSAPGSGPWSSSGLLFPWFPWFPSPVSGLSVSSQPLVAPSPSFVV